MDKTFDQSRYVSTGHLPPEERVARLVDEAYERFKADSQGRTSSVYPSLEAASGDLFGLCVAGTDGKLYATGDWTFEFPVMSVSKPFVFALVCEALGAEAAREAIGVNATGLAFNALEAIDRNPDGRTNPMVNPGAIAATGLVPGATAGEKWRVIQEGLSRFAGRSLAVNEPTFACASASNIRNRDIAKRLASLHKLSLAPEEVLDLYTRQCSLDVSAKDLAVMGATLADGGVNPVTGERVIGPEACKCALAVMATAGLYEKSGDWLYDVGLPGKSGISGGIVAVSPGKGALGAYAPLLNEAGNSVKGQLAARFLSERLGLNLFASKPLVERI